MDWKDVGKKIASAAPLLGGLLGGPPGAAVGTGIRLLASALGLGEQETTPDAIMGLLNTDPEALVAIKKMELENKVELRRLTIEETSLYLQDRAGARQREVDIVRTTGRKDVNLYVLAWTVVLGFFALCIVLMRYPLAEGSNEVVFMLFGGLVAGFSTVLQYFFGSSKSSTDKTNLLARNAHAPPLA